MSHPATQSTERVTAEATGPVFVSGRQFSGNTLMTVVLGRHHTCWSQSKENLFFERRDLFDKIEDPVDRAKAVAIELRIDLINEQLQELATNHLLEWASSNPDADSLAMFLEAMRFVTEHTENTFWLHKATSYIYYAQEILECLPDARIVYMMRNIYDIGASTQKRFKKKKRSMDVFVTSTVAWNKGVRIASQLAEKYPDRFFIVRYEDLVTDPEMEMSRVFGLLGLDFDPEYINVPHINPAEGRFSNEDAVSYTREELAKTTRTEAAPRVGINKTKLFRFQESLSPSSLALIDMVADRSLVKARYPELPYALGSQSLSAKAFAALRLLVSPIRILQRVLFAKRVHAFSVGWLIARSKRRFFAGAK